MNYRCTACAAVLLTQVIHCPVCGTDQRIITMPATKPTLGQRLADLWQGRTPIVWDWRTVKLILRVCAVLVILAITIHEYREERDFLNQSLALPLEGQGTEPEPTAIPGPTSTPRPTWVPRFEAAGLAGAPGTLGLFDTKDEALELVPAAGGTPTTLTISAPGALLHTAAWSPDGSALMLLHVDSATSPRAVPTLYDRFGANPRPVRGAELASAGSPRLVWSPTGIHIAVIASAPKGGAERLYLIDVTSATATQVATDGRVARSTLAWSPDGAQLLYGLGGNDGLEQLVSYGVATKTQQPLASVGADMSAWWRSDATVLYAGGCGGAAVSLCAYELESATARPLIEDFGAYMLTSVAPDGRWLLRMHKEDRRLEAYNLMTSEIQVLDVGSGAAGGVWSPDSQYVSYPDPSGATAIYRLADGSWVRLPPEATIIGWMP